MLTRAVEKGRITEIEKEATLGRLTSFNGLEDAQDAIFVIEAVVENIECEEVIISTVRSNCPLAYDISNKYFIFTNYRNCCCNRESRKSNWYAFYESCSGNEIG